MLLTRKASRFRARRGRGEGRDPRQRQIVELGVTKRRGFCARDTETRERPLHHVPRQVEHLRESVGVDSFQKHARRGAVTVRDHHRVDDERRDPDDSGHALHLLHHLPVFRKVARVLEDEDVRVDAEHLLAELITKPARHTEDRREGCRAERHSDDREGGAHRDEGSLPRAHVSES